MISRDKIWDLALANGFTLRPQPDGSMDLNPYVYEFSEALWNHFKLVEEHNLFVPQSSGSIDSGLYNSQSKSWVFGASGFFPDKDTES